ncbi:MAG: anti-sigma factor [Archangium sp.]
MSCAERRSEIDREFTGEAVDAVSLAQHLETCPACREYREKLANVDTALEKGGIGEGRQNSIEARLFARLNVPAPKPRAPTPEPRPRNRAALYGLMALAAAVLVFFLFPRDPKDDFAPRGVKGDVFGVRAFCVQGMTVVAEARAGQELVCADGHVIQLTYTTPTTGFLSIELDGQEQLTPAVTRWQVDAGIDQPLSFSTPVGDWLSRTRTVTARFRDAKGAEVESSLTIKRQ